MHFNAYYDVNRLESRYFYLLDLRNRYMESVTCMHTHTHTRTHSPVRPPPASDFPPTGLCETETPSHAYGRQTRNRYSDVHDVMMMMMMMILMCNIIKN
jgi:hypothetical protein